VFGTHGLPGHRCTLPGRDSGGGDVGGRVPIGAGFHLPPIAFTVDEAVQLLLGATWRWG